MNQSAGDWPIIESQSSLLSVLPVALEESRRRMVPLAAIFALLALCTLALGIALPKRYSATTSILVEQSNIIGPLMEGRAVPTGVVNRAGIARQVAFSRKVMSDILEAGGWLADKPSALEQEKLIERITDRTDISNPRPNLIQITYTDPDPKRAFIVTEKFAELMISESLATKERESRDAYEIFTERHRAGSIIVTSNRGPDEWLATFADPLRAQSAIDRFTSNAYDLVIEGDSYRQRLKPGKTPGQRRPTKAA